MTSLLSRALLHVVVVLAACHINTAIAAPNGEPTSEHSGQYIVDASASQILVLIRRASLLGRLGHNHIISTSSIGGNVFRHPELSQSRLELELPVAEFVIDEPTLRREEGKDFASVPTERDIAGTRRNMLGKRLLDGGNFPNIRVSGTEFEETEAGATINLTFQVRDHVATKRVPLAVELYTDRIYAQGEFELTHRELGLKPFSALLGTLRVADTMALRFSITARPAPVVE